MRQGCQTGKWSWTAGDGSGLFGSSLRSGTYRVAVSKSIEDGQIGPVPERLDGSRPVNLQSNRPSAERAAPKRKWSRKRGTEGQRAHDECRIKRCGCIVGWMVCPGKGSFCSSRIWQEVGCQSRLSQVDWLVPKPKSGMAALGDVPGGDPPCFHSLCCAWRAL